MKIGVLTSWLSHRSGGLCELVSRLVRSLHADPEYNIKVFGLAGHCTAAESERWGPAWSLSQPTVRIASAMPRGWPPLWSPPTST